MTTLRARSEGPAFLIVEDDPSVARAIARVLVAHGATETMATCASAFVVLESRRPIAVIIDEHLPDGSGLTVLEALATRPVRPAVLVLTGSDDPEVANRAFLLGARYARKPVRADVLTAFVTEAQAKNEQPRARRRAVLAEWQRLYALTKTEAAILELAVEGASRAEMGHATETSVRTIDTHVANLLRKTGDASLLNAVARILRS